MTTKSRQKQMCRAAPPGQGKSWGYLNSWIHESQSRVRLMVFEALTEGWARASVLREAKRRRRLVRLEAVR